MCPSTSVKTLNKAERSGFKKRKQNKLHKAFPVLSWPGRTMFSRKVCTRCWLTWDQFLHFAISVTLYPKHLFFCRLYSRCAFSEAHLETQWKRKPTVCGPGGGADLKCLCTKMKLFRYAETNRVKCAIYPLHSSCLLQGFGMRRCFHFSMSCQDLRQVKGRGI